MRVCKVVKRKDTSVANAYKYARWVYRVVECERDQQGYLNERGVRLLWESEAVTYSGGPKDRGLKADAEKVAAHGNRCLKVGLDPLTPEPIVSDREKELAVA